MRLGLCHRATAVCLYGIIRPHITQGRAIFTHQLLVCCCVFLPRRPAMARSSCDTPAPSRCHSTSSTSELLIPIANATLGGVRRAQPHRMPLMPTPFSLQYYHRQGAPLTLNPTPPCRGCCPRLSRRTINVKLSPAAHLFAEGAHIEHIAEDGSTTTEPLNHIG